MTLVCELDDMVGALAALLEADADPDTNLTAWPDEAWRVKKVLTDDLEIPKEYPVVYVAGTAQERRVVATDGQYEVKGLVEVIVENQYRPATDVTNAKRELQTLARRVEEVLRRNRLHEPYWCRSVFHDADDPLRMELYSLKSGQSVIVGAVLFWHGYRRVALT